MKPRRAESVYTETVKYEEILKNGLVLGGSQPAKGAGCNAGEIVAKL